MTRSVLAGLIVALWLTTPAVAQTLELEILALQSRMRSQAPIPIEATLSWDGAAIIEGYLELTFDNQTLSSQGSLKPIAYYRSPELALATGDRRFRMLLPPQQITNTQGALGIKARFVTSKDARMIELGSHTIVTPRPGSRRVRIGVVLPESQIAIAESQLPFVRGLRLEQFRPPDAIQDDSVQGPLVTQNVRIQAGDLPRSSIEFCVHDLIVLTREGLGEVRPTSLKAMANWLRAGGRALIDMGGQVEDSHVEFLNDVLGATGPEQIAELQPDGSARLIGADDESTSLISRAIGLGRVIVTTDDLAQDFDFESADWRGRVARLWELNHIQQRRVVFAPGKWREAPWPFNVRQQFQKPPAFEPSVFEAEADLTRLLLPDRVQSIPPWHVISLLVVFLLLIAPGDYLLLGLIKRRTLTWILFPVVSLTVTLYTVWLAQDTVGSLDFSTSLTIVDMADDNTVGRSARLEMLFTAAERDAVIDENDGLFTPLVNGVRAGEYASLPDAGSSTYGGRGQSSDATSQTFQVGVEHEPPQFEGLMPRSYRVIRRMRKWTPQLSRRTWIGPPPGDLPDFDWSLIDFQTLAQLDLREKLAETIAGKYPDAQLTIVGTAKSEAGEVVLTPEAWPEDSLKSGPGRLPDIQRFTTALSFPPMNLGWPAVVTRVSPTGSANLEDLWILDRTNPGECLVIVTFPDGDNYIAFRRLYRSDP